jgi:4-amino-4-deoxy-L-arabinose transferase-like glycosyltransferase
MSSKKKYALLIGILIIATFLRFYHFTSTPPGLYPDEAIDGNNAAEVAQTGQYKTFYTEDNGREGLYVNIIAVMFQFFHAPHEPWVIRLPAAVAGVLTVLGLYLLVAELFGDGPGLLAAFLLATSFWHINFSRIGFRAILAPLLLTWALYLLIKAFKAVSAKAGAWYAILAGIVYGFGFYTYIAYRITPLLFLLFIPFFAKKYPDFWKRAGIFIIAVFIVALPIGWYFAQHPADFFGRTSQIAVTNSGNPVGHFLSNLAKTLLMFNVHGDDNWRHNVSGASELSSTVGILFLIGIFLGLYALWRDRRVRDMRTFGWFLTFAWFVLAILPAAASDEGLPHALRSILMLPPAMIFAAIAGMWLYTLVKHHGDKIVAKVFGLLFLAGAVYFAYTQYFLVWAKDPNVAGAFNAQYVEIGRELNKLPTSTPKYVVVAAGGVMTRGIPMSAETTIFITDTFLPEQQAAKNIHYILADPDSIRSIPANAVVYPIQ